MLSISLLCTFLYVVLFLDVVIFFTSYFSLLCTFMYFLLVGVALAGRPLPPAARTHSVFITLCFAPLHNVCLQLVLHFVLFSTIFFGLTRILFALYVSLLSRVNPNPLSTFRCGLAAASSAPGSTLSPSTHSSVRSSPLQFCSSTVSLLCTFLYLVLFLDVLFSSHRTFLYFVLFCTFFS